MPDPSAILTTVLPLKYAYNSNPNNVDKTPRAPHMSSGRRSQDPHPTQRATRARATRAQPSGDSGSMPPKRGNAPKVRRLSDSSEDDEDEPLVGAKKRRAGDQPEDDDYVEGGGSAGGSEEEPDASGDDVRGPCDKRKRPKVGKEVSSVDSLRAQLNAKSRPEDVLDRAGASRTRQSPRKKKDASTPPTPPTAGQCVHVHEEYTSHVSDV